MIKRFAPYLLMLGCVIIGSPAKANSYICIGAMTEIEILFHVKRDAYFSHKPLDGKALRIEYDGCGYRVHVGESSPTSRDGDLLLVDQYGRVTQVVHQQRR